MRRADAERRESVCERERAREMFVGTCGDKRETSLSCISLLSSSLLLRALTCPLSMMIWCSSSRAGYAVATVVAAPPSSSSQMRLNQGVAVGAAEGSCVSDKVGSCVGTKDKVGSCVGNSVGESVTGGSQIVTAGVGSCVGDSVGSCVGDSVGETEIAKQQRSSVQSSLQVVLKT